MVQLENDFIKICVNLHGAELTSIFNKLTNEEMLWQGDPAYWKRQSPVLFPIVGSVWN
ncbi:MAG: aldose 1-epimerase family protein, partial [Muribaculaceae bacterium]|nr:aldose 1-epimerase family protein [Muribaculaceae bacterium]